MRIVFLLLALCGLASGATNTLSWTDPNPAGKVASFRIHWGTNVTTVAAPSTNFVMVSSGGPFTVYMVAVGTNGVFSDPTPVLPVDVPLPPLPRLNGLFQSAPFPTGPWITETSAVLNVTLSDPTRFYRLKGTLTP
jgi:hypothetical protein